MDPITAQFQTTGRVVAALDPAHPAMDRVEDDAWLPDADGWTGEADWSLEPAPVRVAEPRRRRGVAALLVFLLSTVMMAGLALIGVLTLAVLGGLLGWMLMARSSAPIEVMAVPSLELPAEAPVEIAAPVVAAPKAPRAAAPRAPAAAPAEPVVIPVPAAAPPVDPGQSDAKLIVMPDPGFKSVPLDEAVRRLDGKAKGGQIGIAAGH